MNLTREEKIIANTGLGIMIRMIQDQDPDLNRHLEGHPEKHLITFDNIMNLSLKLRLKENN